jgi:hypothetical protein
MIKAQHGFMGNTGDNGHKNHGRRCHIHGWHGSLYSCEYYSRQLKNKIRKLSAKFRANPRFIIIEN